jgi:hypothetical protein
MKRLRKGHRKATQKSKTLTDRQLESDPRFLRRVVQARADARVGRGVKIEDVDFDAN